MSTNPHKGDVTFSVAEKRYTLRYSHLALAKLEQQLDKGLFKIFAEVESWKDNPQDMRINTVLALLWAGLQKHHPAISVDDVSDLLDDLDGGMAKAVEIVGQAMEKAFSAPGTKGTNPPQTVGNGSGMSCSSNIALSDMIPTPSGTSLPAS